MKIIIAGAGAVGTHLAKLFSRENHDITLIDEDASRLEHLGVNYDILTLCASPRLISTLQASFYFSYQKLLSKKKSITR